MQPSTMDCEVLAPINSLTKIQPGELYEKHRLGEPVMLIDVRTPAEFRDVHATIARNIPLDQLTVENLADFRKSNSGQTLYVICQSGTRGAKGCEKLTQAGLTNVCNVDGGTAAWLAAGLPVQRGKKAISLERQVRIAAGLLVFIGAVLGYFVHPAWIALSAFVGAGLVFAGITDSCAMGMLIAKMPWNRA